MKSDSFVELSSDELFEVTGVTKNLPQNNCNG